MNGVTRREILASLVPLGFKPGSFAHFCGMAGVYAIDRKVVKFRLVAVYPPDAVERVKTAWGGGMQ